MRYSLAIRHSFAVFATTVFVMGLAVLVTLPIAGVFLLDESFKVSDYLKFVLSALGVGAGLSLLVMLPLALALEQVVAKIKWLVFSPLGSAFAAGACVLVRIVVTREVLDTVFGWAGLLFALSLVFAFYWTALWVGWAFAQVLQRCRRNSVTS